MPISLSRTPAILSAYQDTLHAREVDGSGCFLCGEMRYLEESNHFFLIPNDYPYTGCKRHDMLVPKRHTSVLNDREITEFGMWMIKLSHRYAHVIWNTPGAQSVLGHLHVHVLG